MPAGRLAVGVKVAEAVGAEPGVEVGGAGVTVRTEFEVGVGLDV